MLTASKTPDPPTAAHDGAEQVVHGVFEPPSGFVATALVRYRWLIGASAVIFALAGLAYGLSRPRVYTSSATLQVGQVNPNSPGFFGYVQSAASLATAFSRSIDAEPVLASVERQVKLTPAQALARLSSSPVPASPAFRVIATGPSERAATQLANAAAGAVIAYEGKSNSTNPQAEALLHEYRQASLAVRRAVAQVAHLSHKKSGYSDTLAAAEAAKNAASVRLSAIGEAYTNAIAARGPSDGLVSLLAGASGASSDRSSKTQRFAVLGLLAGVLIGCLIALALQRRASRRRPAIELDISRREQH
jgi:capsular polysaccharide biosynthesis protein